VKVPCSVRSRRTVRLRGADHAQQLVERCLELQHHAAEAAAPPWRLVRRLEERGDQRLGGAAHEHLQILRERVLVLGEEAARRVRHLTRVVHHHEGRRRVDGRVDLGGKQARAALGRREELGGEGGVGALGKDALFVQQREEAWPEERRPMRRMRRRRQRRGGFEGGRGAGARRVEQREDLRVVDGLGVEVITRQPLRLVLLRGRAEAARRRMQTRRKGEAARACCAAEKMISLKMACSASFV
jgi:hypothetical protein